MPMQRSARSGVSSRAKDVVRVVIDTNILLRAAWNPGGPSGRLYEGARHGTFRLVISPHIIRELRRGFFRPHVRRRYPLGLREIAVFLEELRLLADLVPGDLAVHAASRDPDDNPILACALEGGAQIVVTDDRRDLLPLGQYRGIDILSVPTFLRRYLPRRD